MTPRRTITLTVELATIVLSIIAALSLGRIFVGTTTLDDLIALGPVPSRPRVREVLETAEVVWLTRAQVAGLPRGYRDWRAFSRTLQLSPKP